MSSHLLKQKRMHPRAVGKSALGIMIKAPKPGFSKTRLCPPLQPHESAALSRCFLQDTAENVLAVTTLGKDAVGVAIYTPVGSDQEFERLLPEGFLLMPQRGESFGDRLYYAGEDLLSVGFASVCLIGSDSPTLPSSYLSQMVDHLSQTEEGVVIGPTADGGYYAIGLKGLHRRLFEDIDWSTDRVFAQTKTRVAELAVRAITLPVWYDVDDRIGLERLLEEFCWEDRFRQQPCAYAARHTAHFLNSILSAEGPVRIWPTRAMDSELSTGSPFGLTEALWLTH
jgi:rSAM/selenodomain-associated transferase 1